MIEIMEKNLQSIVRWLMSPINHNNDLILITSRDVHIAVLIGIFVKNTNAGMMRNHHHAHTKPVIPQTISPSHMIRR